MSKKMDREQKTIHVMVKRYCKITHNKPISECEECSALESYALARLAACQFGEQKKACAKCSVHCYRKTMRESMIDVMRKTRVWMLFRHPILTYHHFTD